MVTFTPLKTEFQDIFAEYAAKSPESMIVMESRAKQCFSRRSDSGQIVPLYKFQNVLRPLYGKGAALPPSIGDHPDFVHLRGTNEQEFGAISTMFMDMEGSTRLNLLHPPEDVARIKNAFICMAIEVVKAFDGHVHRIMGDAVMAYFGGRDVRPKAAAIDALNCAAALQMLVRDTVIPYLEKSGFDGDFGIRIGVDHGPAERVLWSSYGYPGMEEVTATSFHVDVASKLQHAAGRHEVMIGQSLQELIDFPEELLSRKTVVRGGEEQERPYLVPNLTDRDGTPINYRQHVLSWARYLEYSPLVDRISIPNSGTAPIVTATLHSTKDGNVEAAFIPTGSIGPKQKWVQFHIRRLPFSPQLPYSVKCIVENHGVEARTASDDCDNHETVYEVSSQHEHRDLFHWETLGYRGLHYLTVEIRSRGGFVGRRRFGVYVE